MRRFCFAIVFAVMLFCLFSTITPAGAAYPEKEITLIIPWAAGGSTDVVNRKLASIMEQFIGKPIVVINTTGGGGAVGFNALKGAAPDGYTIGATSTAMPLNKYSGTVYVPWEDVHHAALYCSLRAAIAVPTDSPYKTIQEFVAASKAAPETIRISNSGTGATWHAVAMTLEKITGAKFAHIPYEGGNPAVTAAAGGHVEAVCCAASEAASLVSAGKLRYLALSGDDRSTISPETPTFKEAGIEGMWGSHLDIALPLNCPPEVINMLKSAMKKAVETDDWKEYANTAGHSMVWIEGDDLVKYLTDLDATFASILVNK
jgi:tripartite-type tricarboxylate transporter receptor subunit TctC